MQVHLIWSPHESMPHRFPFLAVVLGSRIHEHFRFLESVNEGLSGLPDESNGWLAGSVMFDVQRPSPTFEGVRRSNATSVELLHQR